LLFPFFPPRTRPLKEVEGSVKSFSLPTPIRFGLVFLLCFSVVVFPPIFGALSGYYRDTDNPYYDQIFFQTNYTFSAFLLFMIGTSVLITAIRFQRSMKLGQLQYGEKAHLKNPIKKVLATLYLISFAVLAYVALFLIIGNVPTFFMLGWFTKLIAGLDSMLVNFTALSVAIIIFVL